MKIFSSKLGVSFASKNVALLVVALLVIATGCTNGDDEPDISSTAVVPETVAPVQTEIVDPTEPSGQDATATTNPATLVPSTMVPSIQLPSLALDQTIVSSCRLSGDIRASGFSSRGTAPAPTSTPITVDETADPEILALEVSQLQLEIDSAISAAVDINSAFVAGWPSAITTEQQAAQLHVFGNRIVRLCEAASQPSIPDFLINELVTFGDSLQIRHNWVSLAFDELVCCGDAQTEVFRVGQQSTALALASSITSFRDKIEALDLTQVEESPREMDVEWSGLQINIDSQAILVRNTVDFLLIYPTGDEFLDPASLGPSKWQEGPGLRIRRVRNGSEISVAEVPVKFESILNRFGGIERIDGVNIPDVENIRFSYSDLEDNWNGSVTIFVVSGFTYFIEQMCLPDDSDTCSLNRSILESLRVIE